MEVILQKKEDLRKRLRLKRLSFFELATIIQLTLAVFCYFATAFTPLSRIQLLVIKIPNFLFILPPNPNVDTTKITRKYKAVSKYLVWGNALFWAIVWMIFPPQYNYFKTVKSVLSAGIHSYNLTWRLANSLEFEFDIEVVFDWIANKLGALKNLCSSPPKLLTENEFSQVCIKVKEILIDEPNVARINTPVTVVGDVHGQFYDVMEIFNLGGEVPYTNYLFLGDYVDRGYYSIEVLSIFLLLKVIYPCRITLLRGNHETRGITTTYGFYNECKVKYGSEYIWELAMEVFDFFQIASIIDNRIFCIHAGLSPSITFVEQLSLIDRFQEVPPEGPFTDLLWSDPFSSKEGFKPSARNAGYNFGSKVVDKFLKVNGLELILRSHQLIREGYEILFDGKFATVWSAPNYCYVMNNIASILELPTDPNLSNLKDYFNIFVAVPTNERVKPSEPDPEEKKSSTMEYFN